MKDVFVVAHTQSQHHVDGLVGGWYDTSLTELGRAQAARVATRLGELIDKARPLELYASDLKRAAETAEVIGAAFGADVVRLSGLRELSLGSAGGKPQAWLRARQTPWPREHGRLDHREGVEDAETQREFITRIYRAMDQIVASASPTQIIVTHGYAMTFVIAAWIRMPLEAASYLSFKSTSGGITHLHEDDTFFNRAVISLNETAHLAGA
ncbi:MAG: histidine phosphatase family protein [Caulobacterales bacterium]